MRPAALLPVLLPLVCAAACGGGDRITLEFDSDATRAEAIAVDVYAIQLKTRAGAAVDCSSLLAGACRPDDGEVVVAQQTTVPIPVPPGPSPLLVQLPQQRFVFYAVARDRFDFEVARGCAVDTVSSRQPLSLTIALASVPTPGGVLQPVGPTRWLQHAGSAGVRGAPQPTARTLDESGQPRAGIEVRARITAGDAVLLSTGPSDIAGGDAADRLFSDDDGTAAFSLLLGIGQAQLELHARGLADSPVVFDITGLASPSYDDSSHRIDAAPVAVCAGNYDFDAHASPDLLIALEDTTCTYATMWRGGPDGVGFEQTRHMELGELGALIGGGQFDIDNRPDVVIANRDPPHLITRHHDDTLGDSLDDPRDELLPVAVTDIEQMLTLRVDGDAQDDLALKVATAGGGEVLVYVSRPLSPNASGNSLSLIQRFPLPGFTGDPDLAAADVDGDGDDELLILNLLLGFWVVPCGVDAAGTGSGTYFVPAAPTPSSWLHAFPNVGNNFIGGADIDGDGLQDLVVLNDGSLLNAPASLQLAIGDGTLRSIALDDPRDVPLTEIAAAAFADLNGDGQVDVLAVTNSPPQRALLMGGDGSGSFAAPLIIDIGMSTVALAVADANVDGLADLGFLGSTSDGTYFLMKLSR
ncbi:MAG: VCBS repeat-containing protein [Deltaproteobacteria bacterium]|nr:VCBS repeat-containing protein [Deltaproteobacteria bacterium]